MEPNGLVLELLEPAELAQMMMGRALLELQILVVVAAVLEI